MRTIDADALRDKLQNLAYEDWNQGVITSWANAYNECADIVDDMPTVEPPRMSGTWIGTEFDGYADGNPVYYEWKCSACGCVVEDEEPTWNYCPNCGAEMGEQNET